MNSTLSRLEFVRMDTKRMVSPTNENYWFLLILSRPRRNIPFAPKTQYHSNIASRIHSGGTLLMKIEVYKICLVHNGGVGDI